MMTAQSDTLSAPSGSISRFFATSELEALSSTTDLRHTAIILVLPEVLPHVHPDTSSHLGVELLVVAGGIVGPFAGGPEDEY